MTVSPGSTSTTGSMASCQRLWPVRGSSASGLNGSTLTTCSFGIAFLLAAIGPRSLCPSHALIKTDLAPLPFEGLGEQPPRSARQAADEGPAFQGSSVRG